jgi:hypothetical protein
MVFPLADDVDSAARGLSRAAEINNIATTKEKGTEWKISVEGIQGSLDCS